MATDDRWVRDEVERLVAYPTVSNRPVTALAAHVAQRAEDLGFSVERFDVSADKGSVIASIGPEDSEGGLVLSGHLDVVPTENQPWTSDPFRVVERDGKLFGRGTADMKGFVAATCAGLARIAAHAYRRRLVLIWTHDEEIGCLGSAAIADAMAGRPFPRACWIGEPTEFRIQRMHPGHVAAEIEIGGRAAHSSRPDLGSNAIEGLTDVLRVGRDLARELATRHQSDLPEIERPWVVLNLAEVHGGTAINVVPDKVVLKLGYRPLPGHPAGAVFDELMGRIRALSLPYPIDGRLLRSTPAMLTPAGTPLQHALGAHADHPECGAATFATDGGNLARLGMSPLVFGPGSITVAHQADEFVPVADLVRTVDVVEQTVRRWCVDDDRPQPAQVNP
ncbi:MAG: acetylornithine deacetylase [Myxococcota bacterium]